MGIDELAKMADRGASMTDKKEQDYQDGWNDGKAGRPPDPDRLAGGASFLNQYERGWVESGWSDD